MRATFRSRRACNPWRELLHLTALLVGAGGVAPLLDESLVTRSCYFQDTDGLLMRALGIEHGASGIMHRAPDMGNCATAIGAAGLSNPVNNRWDIFTVRAVCVRGDNGENMKVHLDAYAADGHLVDVPESAWPMLQSGIRAQLQLEDLCLEDEQGKVHMARLRPWRLGEHAAVHCQVDDMLSIAAEIRSGRFLRDLFAAMYGEAELEMEHVWTYQGINIGAGTSKEDKNDTDPLFFWTREFASKVVLIDGDEERLQRAVDELIESGLTSSDDAKVFAPIVAMIRPQDAARGHLADTIRKQTGSRVDILKIDIDGFDCAVLQGLMQWLDASVIILESQPLAPPPIKFARQYQPGDDLLRGFYGCSLAYQLQVLHPRYRLLLYTEDDTVFVHRRLAPDLEKLQRSRPGSVFRWTTYPLRFPVDEIDCYHRSRVLIAARRLEETYESVPEFPVEYRREWSLLLDPTEAAPRIWGNLSQTWGQFCEGRFAEFYSLYL